jgi:hypothetical protein
LLTGAPVPVKDLGASLVCDPGRRQGVGVVNVRYEGFVQLYVGHPDLQFVEVHFSVSCQIRESIKLHEELLSGLFALFKLSQLD